MAQNHLDQIDIQCWTEVILFTGRSHILYFGAEYHLNPKVNADVLTNHSF